MNLESKELMSACLRKIPGLNKVKLVDAAWIWTEPHSLRLKIKLTVQKEIINGAVLQQSAVIDFTIRNQQCNNCQSSFAQGAWQAVVQVRQRVSHKRTFFFLEQLLLKHHAHSECINIVTFRDGIDFYFVQKQHAMRFIDFLTSKIPAKSNYSRKLVSADHKSNIGKFKHNFIVHIIPICKDDLLLLPNDLARNLSNISPLLLVKSVNAGVHVVDPFTGERQEIDIDKYMRYEFTAAMSGRDLVKFIVLSIEPMLQAVRASAKRRGNDRKIRLAECIVVRESDFGMNDRQYSCVTHLGHILKEGDTVLGFDLFSFPLTTSDKDMEASSLKRDIPDVILVRKHYPSKGERKWELKNLDFDEEVALSSKEAEAAHEDYEQFLQELEGDREMRSNINLYKKNKAVKAKSTTASSAGATKPSGSKKSTSKKARTAKSEVASNLSTAGSDADNEWEDMDGDDDLNDDDEEAVRLDELLDEMSLSVPPSQQQGVAGRSEASSNATSMTNAGNRNTFAILEEQVVLTADDAKQVSAISIETTGFDAADYDLKTFKFK